MAIRANPYDFIADVRDRNLFAGRRSEIALIREELARLAAMTSAAPVVALIGERRVGKTSLLNRISELASENNILPCTISITNLMAASAGEFWYEVFQRLLSSADAAGVASITASATPVPAVPDKSTAAPAEKAIAGLSQTLNSPDRSVSRYDFFIAYATPDRRQAQELCWNLQDDSCKVFLDQEAVRLGALWQPTVRKALEASRAIVVLVSTHADDAFYQQEEIVRAIELARDKARAHTVIPVILEQLPQGALSMPYGLNGLQAQDATRAGGLQRVAAELVAWLIEKEYQLDANQPKVADEMIDADGVITAEDIHEIGFRPPQSERSQIGKHPLPVPALFQWYASRSQSGTPGVPPMSIVSRDLKILCDAIATQYCGVLFMLSWLRVFTREPTAHLGHRGGPER